MLHFPQENLKREKTTMEQQMLLTFFLHKEAKENKGKVSGVSLGTKTVSTHQVQKVGQKKSPNP